jgi:cytochrome c oxidase assembly factor CtaG
MMPGILAHAAPLAPPTLARVLAAWTFAPLVLVPLFVVGWLYLRGVRRVAHRFPANPWPRRRTAWFLGGLGVIVVALASPVDAYAGVLLWVHMIQHVLLAFVAAPMLVAAAPVTLSLRALAPSGRPRRLVQRTVHGRVVRGLTNPLVAWVLFAATMAGTHFSPLYEASLEHPVVHDLEHLLYLSAGLLFWYPVVGIDPSAWRMPHPLRLLYVILAGPVNTFVALAIYSSGSVLYPYYASLQRTWGPSPLGDQQWAGAIMWVSGDIALLIAVVLVAAAWMRYDRIEAARIDRRLDEQEARLRLGGG